MIDFKHVTKVYEPKITALKDVSVHIDKGEFVFVLGHSGAGKSTFLKLMLREEKATKGEVVVNGYNLSRIREKDIPYMRRTLGVVFQDFRLIPNLTAYENIAFAMRVTNIDEKEIKRRVPYILNLVGLAGKAGKLPAQLSGGEQQRVALARALVHNPDLVIADEPTGNIDPRLSIEIMELLKAINSTGTTVLVVTHEHELARRYAQRTIEMRNGVIVRDTAGGKAGAV
ncbi:MAG: cell division ATP-binding protein FtsE [Oscillospiraceae bacterium]|nr:cell division ATP-binding protein FtsE [Oscillospiraceae bacterium]